MTLTERPPLTRVRIAHAALALIDERGLDQLSMRKLGAELGVEAMSLYNHVANKDDLLDAIVDTLYERVIDAYGAPTGGWRERAEHMAQSYVSVAAAHPHAFALFVHRPPVSHGGKRFMNRVLAIFDDATDDLRVAALAFSVVANWVVGTLVQQTGDSDELIGLDDDGEFARVAAFRKEMLVSLSPEERFAEGLATVLDGVAARYFSASASR